MTGIYAGAAQPPGTPWPEVVAERMHKAQQFHARMKEPRPRLRDVRAAFEARDEALWRIFLLGVVLPRRVNA